MGFTNFIAQNVPVMDPGEGPGGPAPPIFLDQTEAQRAQIFFFWDRPPPLCQGLDDRAPPLSEGLDPLLCGHFISFETDM